MLFARGGHFAALAKSCNAGQCTSECSFRTVSKVTSPSSRLISRLRQTESTRNSIGKIGYERIAITRGSASWGRRRLNDGSQIASKDDELVEKSRWAFNAARQEYRRHRMSIECNDRRAVRSNLAIRLWLLYAGGCILFMICNGLAILTAASNFHISIGSV